MSIQAGLVGLPNVGKSTLFNVLTKSSIPAENYPFCTIDPHVAITHVPDKKLEHLKTLYNSKKIIPAHVTFVDIAGLVKGAASGEGLGNKFLSHIRPVDLILNVLRCFEDKEIMHTGDTIDPLEDYYIINSELMLKDLESVGKRFEKINKLLRGAADKPQEKTKLEQESKLLTAIQAALDTGDTPKVRQLVQDSVIKTIPLLSAKNFLIIANIAEHELEDNAYKTNPHYQALCKKFGEEHVIPICARTEYELSQLDTEDAESMRDMLGIQEGGLKKIIKQTYDNLGLITFFTCGPKEIHAWPIRQGATVRQAAGEIHSDLERGFICADVCNYDDLVKAGSIQKLKEIGGIRTEGQDYRVKDGDIINVKFNV
jgi:ribosome-binding ATPase